MFILHLTPPLGKKASGLAGRGCALRRVVLYPKKRRRMGTTKNGRPSRYNHIWEKKRDP